MKKKTNFSIAGLVLAVIAAFFVTNNNDKPGGDTQNNPGKVSTPNQPALNKQAPNKQSAAKPAAGTLPASTSKVGFTSYRGWQSHFDKHGHEFGKIDADEYLARAKALRDAPPSNSILESKRADGVITRFDKASGGFVAFHKDKTIRTYFRPSDGEAYFRRQARR